jgi:ABC-2 type transport system permease protein
MSSLRGYWSLYRVGALQQMQYRAAAFAGLVTQVFFGMVMVMVYAAFYRSSTAAPPMPLADVFTYVWLGQAFLRLQPWNIDPEAKALIRNGNVAYELLRPLDIYAVWYNRLLAWRSMPTVMRAVPMFVIAGLWFGLRPPASPASLAAFSAAIIGALLLSCAISATLTVTILWTVAGEGVCFLTYALVFLFSGMTIPLPFFPDGMQTLLRVLPFSGLADTPYRLYLGLLPPGEVWLVLLHQLGWAAIIVLFGRWLLARGMRRVVIQGG